MTTDNIHVRLADALDALPHRVIGCSTETTRMEPVSAEEWFHVPASMAEWEEMRLQNMAGDG